MGDLGQRLDELIVRSVTAVTVLERALPKGHNAVVQVKGVLGDFVGLKEDGEFASQIAGKDHNEWLDMIAACNGIVETLKDFERGIRDWEEVAEVARSVEELLPSPMVYG